MLGGDERIGIHLQDVHLVVVRHAHVHAPVVLKPEGVKRGAADLADPLSQVVGHSLGEHVPDLLALAIFLVPFRLVGRNAVLGRFRLPECHLREWQHLHVVVADEPHVQFATLDQLLHDRGLMELVVNELDALREALIVFDHGRLRDTDRGILEQRFDDQRKAQFRRAHERVTLVELGEGGHTNAVVGEDLLGERLVARDEHCRGR